MLINLPSVDLYLPLPIVTLSAHFAMVNPLMLGHTHYHGILSHILSQLAVASLGERRFLRAPAGADRSLH